MKNITQTEWLELLANDEQSVIMDVRTPRECADGIIEGAMMIDILNTPSFLDTIKSLDKTKSYYIYCRSGNRSGQACQIMESMGFQTTYNLMGGMLEWEGNTVMPT